MAEVPLDRFPTDIDVDYAVRTAYADDLRRIVDKLRHGVSVLVECDKQLATMLIPEIQAALEQTRPERITTVMVQASAQRGGRPGRRGRTVPGQEPEEDGETDMRPPGNQIQAMLEVLARVVNEGCSNRIVVMPHLDLITTTTKSGLGQSERDAVVSLYNNPMAVFLGFKDPELEVPEVVERIFGLKLQIIGISPDAIPHVIERREARKFGVGTVETNLLYKFLSGVNAFKIRQIMPQFAQRTDYDPRNEGPRNEIIREIREMTCAADMEVPRVNWEDIGGYKAVKKKIKENVLDMIARRDHAQGPTDLDELEKLVPRGILFEGPAGTGKTFFAKAIATELQAAVIVVSGPELKSSLVGESERNIRNVFIRARKSAPAIIIFDEIDSIASSRAKASPGDPGVLTGMVNTLLTEMDGFKNNPTELVLVIGTTNFAKSLDSALIRPGRFEFVIRIPAPNDDDRCAIFDIYRRKYGLPIFGTDAEAYDCEEGMGSLDGRRASAAEIAAARGPLASIEHVVRRTSGFADPANKRRFSGDDLHALAKDLKRTMIIEGRDKTNPLTSAQIDTSVMGLTRGGELASASRVDLRTDIAGYKDVKDKIDDDIISMLKEERWDLVPKGILFTGPPGTGKTLFARAIADAIDAAVILVSGPELKNKWQGGSEENVREVFEEARSSAPAIIVFDELDSFGSKREAGGNEVHNSMVNTILTEMQGLSGKSSQVLVIGTTNFEESLDPALLSRFNYSIEVPAPGGDDRKEIFKLWAKKLSLDIPEDVLNRMVERTRGFADPMSRRKFSGRDIEMICNDIARSQVRKEMQRVRDARAKKNPSTNPPVTWDEAEAAITQRTIGGKHGHHGPRKLTAAEQLEEDKATAYHECGHTLVGIVLPEASWPFKVSIEAPEDAGYLGVTMREVKEGTASKKALLDEVCSALGGRAAEMIVLDDYTTGASNDLSKATDVVRAMVEDLGMSEEIGPVVYAEQDPWTGAKRRRAISPGMLDRIDTEVEKILKEQATRALALLKEHREALEEMTQALLKARILDDGWLIDFAKRRGWGDRVPAHKAGRTQLGQGAYMEPVARPAAPEAAPAKPSKPRKPKANED